MLLGCLGELCWIYKLGLMNALSEGNSFICRWPAKLNFVVKNMELTFYHRSSSQPQRSCNKSGPVSFLSVSREKSCSGQALKLEKMFHKQEKHFCCNKQLRYGGLFVPQAVQYKTISAAAPKPLSTPSSLSCFDCFLNCFSTLHPHFSSSSPHSSKP